MISIDASTRWSDVYLLSTRNVAFARLLTQIIKLGAHFRDYHIKSLRLNNAGKFTSHVFYDFCSSLGIVVEHHVPHVHNQNGLAESMIKHIKFISRTLLMQSKLPVSVWGHDVLHASILIRLRPTASHQYSPTQLTSGHQPNTSYLRKFGCAIQVPIPPP